MSSGGALSMSGRGTRKRPALSSSSPASALILEQDNEPPTRRARRDVLSCELETLQAELEHEQSLRALDSKRFVQIKQRLEKRCDFAMEEAKDCKALMEEMREENERHMDQLKRAMARTKAELREVQEELEEERFVGVRKGSDGDPRVDMLKEGLEEKEAENEQLRGTIDQLRCDMKELLEEQQSVDRQSRMQPGGEETEGLISEARPKALRELNRVRIRLAETERKNRQYKRIAEDAQRKTKQFLQEKEQARVAGKRIEQLEQELQRAVKAEESTSEQLRHWQSLGVEMVRVFAPGAAKGSRDPDIAVVQKHLNDAKTRASASEKHESELKKELEKANEAIQILQAEKSSFGRKEAAWEEQRLEQEKRQQLYQKDMKVLRSQEGVYKREVESLRSIVKTFDELPLKASQGGSVGTNSGGNSHPANVRALEASLEAADQENAVLKEATNELRGDLKTSMAEKKELQNKHATVLEKFGKLRDALYAERAKAEKAEERANRAEILAGKGSFNPERTRVLHMGANPLTMALKEEIGVLKKQIELLSSAETNKKTKSAFASDVDPNKLHQRLKQSFKEQISRYREGVYLMTGYRVEMIPDNDRYTFKVRSMFAERERDYLVFQWPEGKEVTSLDLLNTEHAKMLTKSPSYEYMTKFHSLPAFLSSVQLSLFEKQTMI